MDGVFPTSFRVEVELTFILATRELLRGTFIVAKKSIKVS